MPAPIGCMGHIASVAVVCPPVCLSPVPFNPKSIIEGHSKLKIGRKKAHDKGDSWPHLDVERLKVDIIRSQNYFRSEAYSYIVASSDK